MPFARVRRDGSSRTFSQGRLALHRRSLYACHARLLSQQAATTRWNDEAASLQVKRIAALPQRDGRNVVLAPAEGLADGSKRQEWRLELQGVPPFCSRSSPTTSQCARLVVDDFAVSTPFKEFALHTKLSTALPVVFCGVEPFRAGQTEHECKRMIHLIRNALAVRCPVLQLCPVVSFVSVLHALTCVLKVTPQFGRHSVGRSRIPVPG